MGSNFAPPRSRHGTATSASAGRAKCFMCPQAAHFQVSDLRWANAMNWEMISAVGQMLGAIGVIISIIYLAVQIRNQNKESQRAAMNVLTTHWSDLNRTLVENPEMAVLWLRALRRFDDLDPQSKLRFVAHLGRFLRFADSLYLSLLDGTLDKRLW